MMGDANPFDDDDGGWMDAWMAAWMGWMGEYFQQPSDTKAFLLTLIDFLFRHSNTFKIEFIK